MTQVERCRRLLESRMDQWMHHDLLYRASGSTAVHSAVSTLRTEHQLVVRCCLPVRGHGSYHMLMSEPAYGTGWLMAVLESRAKHANVMRNRLDRLVTQILDDLQHARANGPITLANLTRRELGLVAGRLAQHGIVVSRDTVDFDLPDVAQSAYSAVN